MTEFLDAALAVAGRLVRDAIWHGNRCSWIGPVPEPADDGLATARSLTADLYAGTSGIGLALAEVAAATGDEGCRRTALGALRHATLNPGRVPRGLEAGFHGGLPGIALACRRGGAVLGSEELVAASDALGRRLMSVTTWPSSYDLIGGRAGGVVAFLALAAMSGESAHADAALQFGDEILAEAELRGAWTWAHDAPGTGLSPSGVSHGPAGVALALNELSAAGAGTRFATAAAAAMAFEDRARDPDTGNWLLGSRDGGGHRPGGLTQSSFVHWCHGAPGIGLVRHRGWRLGMGDGRRRDTAEALALTARWVRAAVDAGPSDFSLCHGLAGTAEFLHDTADAAGDDSAAFVALATEVAVAGVDEFLRRGRPWPCGAPGGESPGLMIGLAGIARFYLRAAQPRLPSVLLPVPADWLEATSDHGRPSASAAAASITP